MHDEGAKKESMHTCRRTPTPEATVPCQKCSVKLSSGPSCA